MASNSYRVWRMARARSLDEMEQAIASIRATSIGARSAVQQITQSYAVMIASQFQGFCRDLHTESATFLVSFVEEPLMLRQLALRRFVEGRQLESKNAQPASLGADFGWFGIDFWGEVSATLRDNGSTRRELERLNDWRNAIAHQDFR